MRTWSWGPGLWGSPFRGSLPLSWTPRGSLVCQLCKVGVCLAPVMLLAPSTELTQHGHSINICWVNEFH